MLLKKTKSNIANMIKYKRQGGNNKFEVRNLLSLDAGKSNLKLPASVKGLIIVL